MESDRYNKIIVCNVINGYGNNIFVLVNSIPYGINWYGGRIGDKLGTFGGFYHENCTLIDFIIDSWKYWEFVYRCKVVVYILNNKKELLEFLCNAGSEQSFTDSIMNQFSDRV